MNSVVALVYPFDTVAAFLGIIYTAKEMAAFGPLPAPFEGFVTFFDPGSSILQLRRVVARKGKIFYPQERYNQARR